jgi:ParB family chromosome partitioning protein
VAKPRTKLITLPLSEIVALRRNPQYLSEKQVEALKLSIDRDGFLAPIVVRKKGAKYEVLSGNHRAMACRELGRESIDCVLVEGYSDAQAARIAVNMNTVHGEPTPELIAPFLADLDEDTMRSIFLDDALLAGIIDFDSTLAERLKKLELPDSLSRDSLKGTIPNCLCAKCGARHVAAPKSSRSIKSASRNTLASKRS